MSGYPKDLEEVILYCAGYVLAYPLAAAGAYASGCVIAGYRTARDVVTKKDYRIEVHGQKGNRYTVKRRVELYQLFRKYLDEDLGIDRKSEI